MKTLLFALQLASFSPAAPGAADPVADRAWADAQRNIRAFLSEWADAWSSTQFGEAEMLGPDGEQRMFALHCAWPPGMSDRHNRYSHLISKVAVTNTIRAHSSCPQWFPSSKRLPQDERLALDAGLGRDYRLSMRLRRLELLRKLELAARTVPADVRLTGQRIRFTLDNADLDAAWVIAQSCQADTVPCKLLQGLVLYRQGLVAEADSAFLQATRAMPEEERCAWNDVGLLLDTELRPSYGAMSCADRASFEARLWWLADPLYLEPGNERRAEHFARKVAVSLLAQLPTDGRQYFDRRRGGEAVVETLIRYGWPTNMHWGGPRLDKGQSGWLSRNGAATAAPYVVREYSRGRIHTLPSPSVFASPFTSISDQWQLNDPGTDYYWWPPEHYARDASRIVELGGGQSGSLRREKTTRFVWAGPLDTAALRRRNGASVTASLFAWRSPVDGQTLMKLSGRAGGKLLIDANLNAGPTLLSIELPGSQSVPAARTRFGTFISEPLSALAAGAQALSQPLFFEPAPDANGPIPTDQAIALMHATTSFQVRSRIGVYWEGYGFEETDTVDVELRVQREDRPGMLARIAGSLGLTQDPRSGAGLRWREEPGSTRAIQITEGTTPVQMRSVVLDLSGLASGSYRITISMATPGVRNVTSGRTFNLR